MTDLDTAQTLQLITAIAFTLAGVAMLTQRRKLGRNATLSGALFLFAAALNWALLLIRL